MIHKTIAITIGLALVLIAVISAVPMQQKVYAQGSPGVGNVGGSGSGNPGSGGNPMAGPGLGTNIGGSSSSGATGGSGTFFDPNFHLFPNGGFGTQGGPGGSSVGPGSGSYDCSLLNCGGGGGTLNSGGNVPSSTPGQGGSGGNSVGAGGVP